MVYIYQKILGYLDDTRRLSDHIELFTRVRLSIEDKTLEELLDKFIKTLESLYRTGDEEGNGYDPFIKFSETSQERARRLAKKQKSKTVFAELEEAIELENYCYQIAVNKTPQWQVVAEKNGWAPKRRGAKIPNWQIEAENNSWIPPRGT